MATEEKKLKKYKIIRVCQRTVLEEVLVEGYDAEDATIEAELGGGEVLEEIKECSVDYEINEDAIEVK